MHKILARPDYTLVWLEPLAMMNPSLLLFLTLAQGRGALNVVPPKNGDNTISEIIPKSVDSASSKDQSQR